MRRTDQSSRGYLVRGFRSILGLLMLFFVADLAAAEVATFEAFYMESSAIGWLVAGVLAIAAGAFIFFTGGTASPVVAGIGS